MGMMQHMQGDRGGSPRPRMLGYGTDSPMQYGNRSSGSNQMLALADDASSAHEVPAPNAVQPPSGGMGELVLADHGRRHIGDSFNRSGSVGSINSGRTSRSGSSPPAYQHPLQADERLPSDPAYSCDAQGFPDVKQPSTWKKCSRLR